MFIAINLLFNFKKLIYSKGDGGKKSFTLKRTASSLKEVGGGNSKVNDILVKMFSYITIINIIIINLLKRLLIKITVKTDKSVLIITGGRGKGVSP